MFATTTIVEIENRLTWQCYRLAIARPRVLVLAELKASLVQADPESGADVFVDHDPLGLSFAEAYVRVRPGGEIQIVIYRAGHPKPAGTARTIPLADEAQELLNARFYKLMGWRAEE